MADVPPISVQITANSGPFMAGIMAAIARTNEFAAAAKKADAEIAQSAERTADAVQRICLHNHNRISGVRC
jgi:hypothetical protein